MSLVSRQQLRLAITMAVFLILAAGCVGDTQRPTQNPDLELRFADTVPIGGDTAAVSVRTYLSDIVVWARLVEPTGNGLRFRAIEYLKGSGESEFVVILGPQDARTSSWDDRDAILFLSLPEGQVAGGNGTRSEYTFTDTVTDNAVSHYGDNRSLRFKGLPIGVRFETRNPVWLPAVEPAAAADTQDPAPHFFVEKVSPAGIELPTISLSELRSMIEWQRPRADIVGYDDCVEASFWREQEVRDTEAWVGVPIEVLDAEISGSAHIPSGAPEGAIMRARVTESDGYSRNWIEEGPHAHLFKAFIFDDDENPRNGFIPGEATTRPLPAGVYTYKTDYQHHIYQPCDFNPISSGDSLRVIAVTPPGTWHEAFFDPVMLPDGSVGANVTQGGLKPARLQSPLIEAEITSLTWSDDSVTLIGNDIPSLSWYTSSYTLDFLELDGSISLSLVASYADVVNEIEASYTWYVPDPPWHPGDKLMLRIREADAGPTIVPKQHDLAAQLRDHRNIIARRYSAYVAEIPAPDHPTATPTPDSEETQQGTVMDDREDAPLQENVNGLWYAFAIVLLLSVGVAGAIASRR